MNAAEQVPHVDLAPEDMARANFYGLLSRLFADAPDAALLAAIAAADRIVVEDGDRALADAWSRLVAASARTDAQAVRQEYDDVFVGVGKSEVNLHASHWLTGFMMERPLVALRERLAGLGLARRPGTGPVEDHLASLCETMRVLIAGDGSFAPVGVDEQRRFFESEIETWFESCCNAIENCRVADYYRNVAVFSRLFLGLEREAFRIG